MVKNRITCFQTYFFLNNLIVHSNTNYLSILTLPFQRLPKLKGAINFFERFFHSLFLFRKNVLRSIMAWRCSSNSQQGLVQNMQKWDIIRKDAVFKAMATTDRQFYAPNNPHEDRPQYIGFGATISAPHMHAHALELLNDHVMKENSRILDVGSGSGYLQVLLNEFKYKNGKSWVSNFVPKF